MLSMEDFSIVYMFIDRCDAGKAEENAGLSDTLKNNSDLVNCSSGIISANDGSIF